MKFDINQVLTDMLTAIKGSVKKEWRQGERYNRTVF